MWLARGITNRSNARIGHINVRIRHWLRTFLMFHSPIVSLGRPKHWACSLPYVTRPTVTFLPYATQIAGCVLTRKRERST